MTIRCLSMLGIGSHDYSTRLLRMRRGLKCLLVGSAELDAERSGFRWACWNSRLAKTVVIIVERDRTADGVVDEAYETLLTVLRESDSAMDAVARVVRAGVELMFVDGASVALMMDPDRREMLYASDEVAAHIEAVQFSLAEGPCFEAFETGCPVLSADLRPGTCGQWPVFASEMANYRVAVIDAFPLISGTISVGAMNLYRRSFGRLSMTDIAIAVETADMVARALPGIRMGAGDKPWQSDLPFERAETHQATGMLAAGLNISTQHALARLRSYAFATGRLVDDIADDLVARRLAPDDLDRL